MINKKYKNKKLKIKYLVKYATNKFFLRIIKNILWNINLNIKNKKKKRIN